MIKFSNYKEKIISKILNDLKWEEVLIDLSYYSNQPRSKVNSVNNYDFGVSDLTVTTTLPW